LRTLEQTSDFHTAFKSGLCIRALESRQLRAS